MKNHTVVQLKAIAKDRGIRGYYKLRKAELIHALEATKLEEQKRNIFDEPIPNYPTPVLQPTPWRPSNIALNNKRNIKNFAAKKHAKDRKFLYYGYAKDYRFWRVVVELHITKTKNG